MTEHIETMVDVFREVRRVLRKDGTVWLNYGDCYATAPNGRSAADTKAAGNDDRTFRDKPFSTVGPICNPDRSNVLQTKHPGGSQPKARIEAGGYLKPKDLCMIPNRLAIALQDDGWWVRSEIIWAKPNPMPESVTDRPATAHEKVWLLSKSARYFYDAEAVRTGWTSGRDDMRSNGLRTGTAYKDQQALQPNSRKTDKQRGHSRRHAGFNDRWDAMSKEEQTANGANLRNVWTIPTKGYSEAHFATYPPALVETCIKAGTSEKGCCAECGAPWVRNVERTAMVIDRSERTHEKGQTRSSGTMLKPPTSKTLGFSPSCQCNAATIPCTVLDPFIGSGTTAMVADRLQRDCIGIDLNTEYVDLAVKRITDDAGMFAEIVT